MARRKAATTTAECLAQIEQEIDSREQELKELKAQRKQLLQQKKQEDLKERPTIKELQKLIEYGRNYQTHKPVQDEYRQIRRKEKQEKFAEARRAELTTYIISAARYFDNPKPQIPVKVSPKSGRPEK